MTNQLQSSQTPEERELAKKKAELGHLSSELAERELELATFRAEMLAFEKRYLRTVGLRYAQLDDIEAKIADFFARSNPEDDQAQHAAEEAKARASESSEAAGDDVPEDEKPQPFTPTEDLKKLFREVAKAVHPDHGLDSEKARRTELMGKANNAFAAGDEDTLRQILRDWRDRPESVEGEGVGADLVRMIRQIAAIEDRIENIAVEIAELSETELHKIKVQVEEAETEERDLLAEMAQQLDDEIEDATVRLDDLMSND